MVLVMVLVLVLVLGNSRASYVGNRWGYDTLCTQIPAGHLASYAMLPNLLRLAGLSLHIQHVLAVLLCVLAGHLLEG
jgi:hypothetical protein